jgi:hypothetical protein
MPSANLSYVIYHFGLDLHALTVAVCLLICAKIFRALRK